MADRAGGLSTAAFLVAVAALAAFALESADLGFHLAAGALIASTGEIPTVDPFSYVAAGRPWIDSHWLFQLVVHGVSERAGAAGLVVGRIALVVAISAVTLRRARRRGGLPLGILACSLAVASLHDVFILRPTLFTLLFLGLFLAGLDRLEDRPRTVLVGLPLLQVIWVNVHGLWVLGVGTVALHALGGALQVGLHRRWPSLVAAGPPTDALRREAGLLLLCAGASLANANGLAGITYPWTLLVELAGGVGWFPRLVELQPPLSVPVAGPLSPEVFYRILLGLTFGAAALRVRRVRLADALPLVAFAILSLRAGRNVALFALVAAPLLAGDLRALARGLAASGRLRWPSSRAVSFATAGATLALAAAVVAGVVTDALWQGLGWGRRFGFGESPFHPAAIVEPLRARPGRFFNDSTMGGYLIGKLHPDAQVAMDGRWEVYGELLYELEAVMAGPVVFEGFAREHDVRTIALMRRSPDARRMRRWLRRSPVWRPILQTPNAILYGRVTSGSPDDGLPVGIDVDRGVDRGVDDKVE